MQAHEVVIIVLMVGYAIYRQTQRHEVIGATRFKLAIIYGIVGVVVGGYHVPDTAREWVLLLASLLLSVVVGAVRGRFSRLWAQDGRVWTQGTPLTVGLFLAMVAVKVALGFIGASGGAADDEGFGEVLLMIALMVAFQAEIVWRRAQPLGPRARDHDPVGASGA